MAEPAQRGDEEARPIIIKKIKKGGGGHHGGAWKVAYADFVTAMMAFFLLLWLLNVTTDEAKNAISGYFDPTAPRISDSASGAGGVLGGLTMSSEGAMASTVQPIMTPHRPETTRRPYGGEQTGEGGPTPEEMEEAAREAEEARFASVKAALERALSEDPELFGLSENLLVDMTPEGLRIQIIDREGGAMFPRGSAQMFDKTRHLVALIAKVVAKLPNEASIRGHTDSAPYGTGASYTNWELSADRANATRLALLEAGLAPARVNNVMGKADREHLVPDKPLDPRNRRISVILLREELKQKPVAAPAAQSAPEKPPALGPGGQPVGTFRKTPGAVAFP